MSDKIEKFMGLLGSVWGKRHESEEAEAEWLRAWANMLKPFEPWVLEAAAQRLIETRRDRYFPTPAEVRDLLVAIRAEDARSKPQMKVSHADQHPDPLALADHLIDCQLGRTAARDNPSWIVPLHDFCRENRRLPLSAEIAQLKKSAIDGEQIEYAINTGKLIDLLPPLREFRERNKWRREKLRRRLLGDEADKPTPSTFVPDPDWMDKARAALHAREAARDPANAERYRLAREWREKVTAEYGSVDRFLTVKRPPGNVAQNKRG